MWVCVCVQSQPLKLTGAEQDDDDKKDDSKNCIIM